MKMIAHIAMVPIFILLTVDVTKGRSLGDSDEGSGLLLSALCFKEGQLRKACLEEVTTLSIQKFFDKIIQQIKDNNRYGTLIRDLDISDVKDDDDIIQASDLVPEKRGRSRQTSGFYSNW